MKSIFYILFFTLLSFEGIAQINFPPLRAAAGNYNAPLVSTNLVNSITPTTVSTGGNLANTGGKNVTDKGIVVSTSSGPTISSYIKKNVDPSPNSIGDFTSNLTGLTPNTLYYIRAYATNSIGTSYGAEKTFNTIPTGTVLSLTGEIWMDKNLGATQAATSISDAASYGDYYQWGRPTDGHQIYNTANETTVQLNSYIENSLFVFGHGISWINQPYDQFWQGPAGYYNPCPTGYAVPTEAEWKAEMATWSSQDAAGAFASPLKLPLAGMRTFSGGPTSVLIEQSSSGYYWSSTATSRINFGQWENIARRFRIQSNSNYWFSSSSVAGSSCRCIKRLSVGESYQGGVIVYLLNSGDIGYDENKQHGLIAANYISEPYTWNNGSYILTNASGEVIGTGAANTNAIISSQGNTGTYAAKVCKDYRGGGYSDWYLPSFNEFLQYLYNSAGFYSDYRKDWYYWTSTETGTAYAWAYHGRFENKTKDALNYGRVVPFRSF